jgi:hypothetical protein
MVLANNISREQNYVKETSSQISKVNKTGSKKL